MQLAEIYESYKTINNEYMIFLEELVNKDFVGYSEDLIAGKLQLTKENIEELLVQLNVLEIEAKDEVNLKDLQYLLTDQMFLTMDLIGFYQYKEMGRFKMRVLNAINKKNRAELFGDTGREGNCRVSF